MLWRMFRPIDWSIRWPIHVRERGWVFLKTFPIIAIQSPRSSEFDAVRRIFVLGKNPLLIVNFHFRAIDNGG